MLQSLPLFLRRGSQTGRARRTAQSAVQAYGSECSPLLTKTEVALPAVCAPIRPSSWQQAVVSPPTPSAYRLVCRARTMSFKSRHRHHRRTGNARHCKSAASPRSLNQQNQPPRQTGLARPRPAAPPRSTCVQKRRLRLTAIALTTRPSAMRSTSLNPKLRLNFWIGCARAA